MSSKVVGFTADSVNDYQIRTAIQDRYAKHGEVFCPHTATAVSASEWTHAYPRELAAFPLASLRQSKYWPPVARIDQAYGDRNLVCACPPPEAFA